MDGAVIGGIDSLEGPIVGTVLYFLLRKYLANFGAWYLIILGLVPIGVVLFLPQRHPCLDNADSTTENEMAPSSRFSLRAIKVREAQGQISAT